MPTHDVRGEPPRRDLLLAWRDSWSHLEPSTVWLRCPDEIRVAGSRDASKNASTHRGGVRECACRRVQGGKCSDRIIRRHYEAVATNWRKLAEDFEFFETAERFLTEKWNQGREIPLAPAAHHGFSERPVEPYRQFAIDCIKLASRTKIAEDKRLLEQMAETWLRLAEQRARKGPRSQ